MVTRMDEDLSDDATDRRTQRQRRADEHDADEHQRELPRW